MLPVSPAVRTECRRKLSEGTDESYGTALEQCIWQWSQGLLPEGQAEPTQRVKPLKQQTTPGQQSSEKKKPKTKPPASKKAPPTKPTAEAPKSRKRKAPASAASSSTVAENVSECHQLYAGKVLQMLFQLRQPGWNLWHTRAPDVLVWLDDAALSGATPTAGGAVAPHAQRVTSLFEESKHHTSVQPKAVASQVAFLVCKKCKSTDVAFNQKQTRSGDEGMTSFCRCNACSHTWKM